MKGIKIIEGFLAWAFMLCVFVVLIISAVELAVYADMGYFESEYEKYDVIQDEGLMAVEMDELMRVTKQMLSYLRGDRENLIIYANVEGQQVEFFDERDKSHMVDVQGLFLGAIYVRRVALLIGGLVFANLCVLLNFDGVKRIIFSAYKWTVGYLSVIIGVIGVYAVVDFTSVFYKFHALFFSDYEWILDPAVSRLINIVPEGFFVDTAIRIVVIFIVLVITMGLLLYIAKRVSKTKHFIEVRRGGTYEQG